jgi:hypothetical protein
MESHLLSNKARINAFANSNDLTAPLLAWALSFLLIVLEYAITRVTSTIGNLNKYFSRAWCRAEGLLLQNILAIFYDHKCVFYLALHPK